MIQIKIGTNYGTEVQTITKDPATSVKSVLEEYGIDYTRGGIHLDGLAIAGGELEKSFSDFGVTEKCYLISVVKGDGGCR